jgi:apolipoprotein D and lipocalin family protein
MEDKQKAHVLFLYAQPRFRMFNLHPFIAVISCLMVFACSTIEKARELPTASSVDLSRYAGMWHEIARLPMWAQRNCVQSTAEYRLRESGEIGVRNACVTTTGETIRIEGVATVVDQDHPAKLNVVFDQWAAKLVAYFSSSRAGNYWILRVDPDYQLAVVGTPDRDFLWILARTPTLDEARYQDVVSFSQRLGFPTKDLIRSPAPTD